MNEIINRLKELSDKATPGEWRDDRGDILDSDGVLFEGIGLRDYDAALAVDAVNFVRSTLTNLTPSGVERSLYTSRHISHEEAREVAGRLINSHFHLEPHARIGIPARPDYDDDLLILAYIEQQAALALPSEPPSQGDVE